MVDDYSAYKTLFSAQKTQAPCIELGCWAHVRRKFFDLHQANASAMALEALTRIGVLYDIERQGWTLDAELRCQLLRERSLLGLAVLHLPIDNNPIENAIRPIALDT